MQASIVSTTSPEWLATLRNACHDFYHEPGYVELSARYDGGDPCAILASEGDRSLLLPLVIRPIESGGRDAISPYGYAGPIVCGDGDASFVADALAETMRTLEEEGIISVFVRCHPLLDPEIPEGPWTVVTHADTVSVDLTLSLDEQWVQMRRNHRQQIRQAVEKGYVADVDHWQHYGCFQDLYRSTMERVGARPYYAFDEPYFESLRHALADRIHLATVSLGATVVAAGLFVATCGIVELHLVGQDEESKTDRPVKLLIDHVRRWSTVRDHQVLHLGGGRGGCEDSLFHFKAGFSDRRRPFRTLRYIADDDAYRRLVTARDPGLDPDDTRGVFPLYR